MVHNVHCISTKFVLKPVIIFIYAIFSKFPAFHPSVAPMRICLKIVGNVTRERDAASVKTIVNKNVKVETWYLAGNGVDHWRIHLIHYAPERSEHA